MPITPTTREVRYRARQYSCDGSMVCFYSNDFDELSNRLDCAVNDGRATGGEIDENVRGIGWTVACG